MIIVPKCASRKFSCCVFFVIYQTHFALPDAFRLLFAAFHNLDIFRRAIVIAWMSLCYSCVTESTAKNISKRVFCKLTILFSMQRGGKSITISQVRGYGVLWDFENVSGKIE